MIGPNDPNSCVSNPNNCGEANLDVQYIMAMAQGAPLTYWSIEQENGDIFLGTASPRLLYSLNDEQISLRRLLRIRLHLWSTPSRMVVRSTSRHGFSSVSTVHSFLSVIGPIGDA